MAYFFPYLAGNYSQTQLFLVRLSVVLAIVLLPSLWYQQPLVPHYGSWSYSERNTVFLLFWFSSFETFSDVLPAIPTGRFLLKFSQNIPCGCHLRQVQIFGRFYVLDESSLLLCCICTCLSINQPMIREEKILLEKFEKSSSSNCIF